MSRMRAPTAAPVALLAAFAAGCATFGLPDVQPLTLREAPNRPSTVRLLAPSFTRPEGGLGIRLWMEAQNPNPVGVTLSEVSGTLWLEEEEGPEADFPLGLPLEAGQDTVVPLDLALSFGEVPTLADALRRAVQRGALGYRLEGTFSVSAGRVGPVRFGPETLLEGELAAE